MIEECYDNSFARFVAAFIGDGKLTKEEADELRNKIQLFMRTCSMPYIQKNSHSN